MKMVEICNLLLENENIGKSKLLKEMTNVQIQQFWGGKRKNWSVNLSKFKDKEKNCLKKKQKQRLFIFIFKEQTIKINILYKRIKVTLFLEKNCVKLIKLPKISE